MWFRETLAMRRVLIVYTIVIAAIAALNAWGAGDAGGIYFTQATLGAAGVSASVLAIFVGNRLGRERGKMATSALLRPISREGYAWTIFAVDSATLVLAYTIAATLIVGTYQAAHGFPPLDLRGASLLTCVILPLGGVFAFYGLMTVCSVLTRGSRFVAILVGPLTWILYLAANVQVHAIARPFQLVGIINPTMYLMAAIANVEASAHPGTMKLQETGVFGVLPLSLDATILYSIALSSLLLATLSWKRAEI
jgi:hypothetical protein